MALQNLSYPHRRTKPYSVEGVQYPTKRATLKFYDKCLESENIHAQGILRQETTLRTEGIRKLTGKKKTKLADLSKEILLEFMREELRKLNILDISIGNRDTTCSQLVSQYGRDAGLYYLGYLYAKDLSPNKNCLARSLEVHPRSLHNRLKKIVNANVAPTITSCVEPLPALTIDPQKINETTPVDASFQNG